MHEHLRTKHVSSYQSKYHEKDNKIISGTLEIDEEREIIFHKIMGFHSLILYIPNKQGKPLISIAHTNN